MNVEYHNQCLAACRIMRAKHPEFAARFDRRESVTIGTPEHEWFRDMLALNDAASSGGKRNRRANAAIRRYLP